MSLLWHPSLGTPPSSGSFILCYFYISINSPALLSLIVHDIHSLKLQDKDPRLRQRKSISISSVNVQLKNLQISKTLRKIIQSFYLSNIGLEWDCSKQKSNQIIIYVVKSICEHSGHGNIGKA
jgi:hypothetical protein